MAWVAVAGAAVGVAGNYMSSKNASKNQQTQKQEPWAPAQPYLTQGLADNALVMDNLKANPFNSIQKQGYQGLLGDQDNFRQNVAPGLLDFANQGMTSQYQRPIYDKPGQAGGYGGAQPTQQGGLLSTGRQGPFSVAQQPAHGQIDWNKMNPWYQSPEQVNEAARLAEEERLKKLQQPQQPQYQDFRTLMEQAGGGA